MGIFSTNFRQVINTQLGNTKQVLASTPCQTVMASLNRYRSYLTTRTGVADSFIGALTVDSELISDKFLNSANVAYDNEDPTFVKIDEDLAEYVSQGLSECVHAGLDTNSFDGVTITDSKGYAYNIIDQRSEHVFIDGKEIIFSTAITPSSISDALIFRDNEGIHLNNFIKTNNFWSAHHHRTMPSNIFDIIADAFCIEKGYYPANMNIAAIVKECFGWEDDIYSSACQYVTDHLVAPANDILNVFRQVWEIVDTLHPIVFGQGYVNSLWSVVRDNMESNALNSFILRVANCVLSGVNVATEITTLVQESIIHKYNSIKNFGKGIATAYNRGGVYGVACYIMTYIKELCEAQEDDGTLKFTDNSRYAPAIYLAGIINTIISVMSTVLSLLVSVFSKIAGVALMLIGSVISSIFKAIQYDYDSTNAAINTDDKVTIPITPYGLFQCEVPMRYVVNRDLRDLLDQGENFVYCEIPGGYLICGPGSFNDETGEVTTMRYEFHPSIADSGSCAYKMLKMLYDTGYLHFDVDSSNVYDIKCHPYLNQPDTEDAYELCGKIADYWNQALQDKTFENQSNDHLSDDDDLSMRHIISNNISIGIIYLSLLTSVAAINNSNFKLQADFAFDLTWWADNISATGSEGSGSGVWEPLTHMGPGYYFSITFDGNKTLVFNKDSASKTKIAWLGISNQMISPFTTAPSSLAQVINGYWYFDEFTCFNNDLQPAIFIPKYDKLSFWGILLATMVVSALAAAAISIVTFKVKRAIIKKRSINQAKVAQAYDNFTDDPTPENYEVYRKAVKKNNLWATFIGGSKFDTESYWNGAVNAEEGSSTGEVSNPFSIVPSVIDGQTNTQQVSDLDSCVDTQGNVVSLERLKVLIAG